MSFLLTATGVVLLIVSLLGVVFGVYMSTHPRSRESGLLFAGWWIPAVGASLGVLLRDPVTFTVGLLCFLVAGTAFILTNSGRKSQSARGGRSANRQQDSSKTTKENRTGKGYKRAAS